ncbi:MAG: AI-2E family transporter [Bacillota bacterium]
MSINTPPSLFVNLVWILTALLLALVIYYLINIGNQYVPKKKVIKYNTRLILWVIIILFGIYFISLVFRRYTLVADTFYTIIISMILAYFLNPLVNFFERKGLKRIFATITVYLLILAVISILSVSVIPRSGQELKRLAANFPGYVNTLSAWMSNIYSGYSDTLVEMPELLKSIEDVISQNIDRIQSGIASGVEKFVLSIVGLFTKIISWILTPILTFYLLVDKDHFVDKFRRLIPKKHKEDILELLREIDIAMSQFIRGRLLMAVMVGITTTIFLFLMGIEFAIVIGFITGIADIIPYIGPFLGFIPAVIFAFIVSPVKAIWVGVFFILIQWVENNILGPKVLGKSTGMHPLTILLAIIVGGTIFGVMGMILSVPAVSVFIILFHYVRERIAERFPSDTGRHEPL